MSKGQSTESKIIAKIAHRFEWEERERVGDSGEERERVGDSGEEREREWGIVGKKGREWGIAGNKGEKVGDNVTFSIERAFDLIPSDTP